MRLLQGNRLEGQLIPWAELRKSVEVGRDHRSDARIAAGGLVVSHENDRRAVSETLDVTGHYRIGNE
jgi:hypothetical protein